MVRDKMKRAVRWSVAVVLAAAGAAQAEVKLANVLTSNMLLQRETPVRIWGSADAGEKVEVTFAGQTKHAAADMDGKWSVELDAMPASGEGREMAVKGTNEIKLSNVVVGDVWVCSGQSNMEYRMKRRPDARKPPAGVVDRAEEELAKGKHDGIRLFTVQKVWNKEDVVTTGWQECEGVPLEEFSAVGFFFGKELYEATKVPIGLINTSWGGSRIELWTPDAEYMKYPELKAPTTRPMYLEGSPVGRYYNGMVRPLTPYAVKGFTWYQGESNCVRIESDVYTIKMKALIESWRSAWNNAEAPFYYVQIAPLKYSSRKIDPTTILPAAIPSAASPVTNSEMLPPETLPRFLDAQKNALSIPHTGMAVTTDLCNNLTDIHPFNKWDVGHRLAVIALRNDYGMKDVIVSGPVFKSMSMNGSAVIAEFAEVGHGLKTKDGKAPSDFQIAGDDGVFSPAIAEIVEEDKVKLTSASVSKPTMIRFAWNESVQPNFYNSADLPAVPFRTDSIPPKR